MAHMDLLPLDALRAWVGEFAPLFDTESEWSEALGFEDLTAEYVEADDRQRRIADRFLTQTRLAWLGATTPARRANICETAIEHVVRFTVARSDFVKDVNDIVRWEFARYVSERRESLMQAAVRLTARLESVA